MEICADREMVSRTVNHMTCCSRSAMMRWNVRGSGFRNLLIVCFFFTTALCCACAQLQKVLGEEEGHHLTCDNPRLFVIYASLHCNIFQWSGSFQTHPKTLPKSQQTQAVEPCHACPSRASMKCLFNI